MDLDEKTLARFWSKVDKRGPDECWEWRGKFTNHGSATLSVGGKERMVTRLMWSLAGREPLPDSRAVLFRSCGNLKCVNPAHLVRPEPRRNPSVVATKRRMSLYEMAALVGARLIPSRSGRYLVRM